MRPLLGADRVTVQRVDHGITTLLVFLIAGRQKDDDVAIDGIAFEIAFECCAVDLDVLHLHGLCAGDYGREHWSVPAPRDGTHYHHNRTRYEQSSPLFIRTSLSSGDSTEFSFTLASATKSRDTFSAERGLGLTAMDLLIRKSAAEAADFRPPSHVIIPECPNMPSSSVQ